MFYSFALNLFGSQVSEVVVRALGRLDIRPVVLPTKTLPVKIAVIFDKHMWQVLIEFRFHMSRLICQKLLYASYKFSSLILVFSQGIQVKCFNLIWAHVLGHAMLVNFVGQREAFGCFFLCLSFYTLACFSWQISSFVQTVTLSC